MPSSQTPSTVSIAEVTRATRERVVARGVATAQPLVVSRADGTRLWDTEGNEFLDFATGIGVLNVGHCHPGVVAAVQRQAELLTHACFQVTMYEPYVRLVERLCALVDRHRPIKGVLLSTGAEATENAVKIARAHTRRPGVIAFTGGFHGRTLMGLSLTASSSGYRQNFGPFAPEVYHVPFPYEYRGWTARRALDGLEELLQTRIVPGQVAAVIVEAQLGEGGFVPAPVEFLRELRRLTEQHGIVLVLDEIQTGFGRTGRMFAYEHYGIEPDLITVAKSIAGGLPLAAVLGSAEIMDAPAPGGLGGTYAGNPLACAAALAVLDAFEEEGLLERAREMALAIRRGLLELQERFPQIGDVRGLGAMQAIELVRDPVTRAPDAELAQRVLDEARSRGLLLLRCGLHKNVVRLLPPLVASPREIADGLAILGAALAAAARNPRHARNP